MINSAAVTSKARVSFLKKWWLRILNRQRRIVELPDQVRPQKNVIRELKQLTTTPPKWATGSKNALLASTAHAKD